MKVVVDNHIPYVRETLRFIADEAIYVHSRDITPALVKDADALVIRTRTKCNRELLEGSSVQFIATATIGYDHIDTEYCREAGIAWINAPGSNANSVAEYIESALSLLARDYDLPFDDMKMGIIGAGNVGTRVAEKAKIFGLTVLENDPPRAEREGSEGFCSLEQIVEECDIISFHTPLNMDGPYKTYHLADEAFFRSLKKEPIIINTSRGEVIDTQALLMAMDEGLVSDAVIDVWENEPNINRELLEQAYIATPHIAGYSAEGKANASRMALIGLCKYFRLDAEIRIRMPRSKIPAKALHDNYDNIALLAYDPMRDTKWLKNDPESFEYFRNNYPIRREAEVYYKAWDKFISTEVNRKRLDVLDENRKKTR